MTDERLEQILKQALAPDIDDSDIQIKKRERSHHMKHSFKIVAAAACAALIALAGIGGSSFLRNQPESVPYSEDSFVLKVHAEELEEEKGVPVAFGANEGWCLGGTGNNAGVYYCISTGFNCEGDDIESITYSINKGAFQIVENPDASIITNGKKYEGTINAGQIGIAETMNYYTEFTLDYDTQSNDTTYINICGEVIDSHLYDWSFNSVNNPENYNPETDADVFTDIMKGVEIICTVHYTDGTSASETVLVEGRVMTPKEIQKLLGETKFESNDNVAAFVFKLK